MLSIRQSGVTLAGPYIKKYMWCDGAQRGRATRAARRAWRGRGRGVRWCRAGGAVTCWCGTCARAPFATACTRTTRPSSAWRCRHARTTTPSAPPTATSRYTHYASVLTRSTYYTDVLISTRPEYLICNTLCT